MKKRVTKRILAVLVCAALVVAVLPAGVFSALEVEKAKLDVAVISDIHYYAAANKGPNSKPCADYLKWYENSAKEYEQIDELLDSALAKAVDAGSKYVLVPGDLTNNGELDGHKGLAARLEKFETETGISVIVTNGNHDINNSGATSFKTGKQVAGGDQKTTPEQFREIYKNLGFDIADSFYTPPAGEKAGMLSYSVKLDGGYRLIVIDGCRYSADNTNSGEDEHETGSRISEGLMSWILAQCEDAQNKGETIVGMGHHNFVPHMSIEDEIFGDFVYENWMEFTEKLTDAGMHFAFSGHLHTLDIASHVNDNGETFYDIETSSLTGYPNMFRTVTFDNTDGDNVTFDVKGWNVDWNGPIESAEYDHSIGYAKGFSFFKTYGPDDLHTFAMNSVTGMLGGLFSDIQAAGGLSKYLTASGIDLEKIITDALGTEGLSLAGVDIFTVKSNLMSFINDLLGQVDKAYINNPDYVYGVIDKLLTKAFAYEVSDVKCTKFYKEMGITEGSKYEKGTIEDLAYSILLTLYSSDEDISDDAFLKDALDYFKNRDGAKELINFLLDTIINDLLEDEILSTLNLNINTLFPSGTVSSPIGVVLNVLLRIIFRNDVSFENIITSVLGILPEDYSSIRNILDTLLINEYLTQSQYDSIGYTVNRMGRSLVEDTNPGFKKDINAVLTYSGAVTPEATAENYRLPSNIGLTFADDSASERAVNWYTKYSVTGTDIQIVPYVDKPTFTDKLPSGVKVEKNTETVSRSYPGVDLGVIGFIPKTFNMVRHTVEISGLEPGTKYSYRVGDASRGWWSEAGVIETADKSDAFTFFHATDQQSQNVEQYGNWGSVVDTAFKMFPQGKFFMSTGDQVDYTEHFTQWSWFFNASPNIKNTVIMPTAGNHEDEGHMLDQNFILPTTVEQNRESGVFYSFDYNNAHFIVLNTNNLSDSGALSDEQLAWLKADAEKSNAQWKIVALHKALYSNGSHYDDDDVVAMREQLCGLMPDLGIDLVLQGHDHVYLRTDIMDNNEIVDTQEKTVEFGGRTYSMKLDPKGTVYVISATAGVKTYLTKDVKDTDKLFPRAEALYDATESVFSAITIDGDTLYFDAFMLDAKAENGAARIDSFALSKAPVTDKGDEEKPTDKDETTDPSDENDPTIPGASVPSEETTKPGEPSATPGTGSSAITASAALSAIAGACLVLVAAKRKKEDTLIK